MLFQSITESPELNVKALGTVCSLRKQYSAMTRHTSFYFLCTHFVALLQFCSSGLSQFYSPFAPQFSFQFISFSPCSPCPYPSLHFLAFINSLLLLFLLFSAFCYPQSCCPLLLFSWFSLLLPPSSVFGFLFSSSLFFIIMINLHLCATFFFLALC